MEPTTVLGLLQAGSSIAGSLLGGGDDRALKLAEEQFAFARAQRERWTTIYGDIEENLGNYFENLSPEKYKNKAVANIAKQFSDARMKINKNLAARGLAYSNYGLDVSTQLEFQEAAAKAKAASESEDVVNKMKQGFIDSSNSRYAADTQFLSQAGTNLVNAHQNSQQQDPFLLASSGFGALSKVYEGKDSWGSLFNPSATDKKFIWGGDNNYGPDLSGAQ